LDKIEEWIEMDKLHNQSTINKINLKFTGVGRIKELKLSKTKIGVNKNHKGRNGTSHCPTMFEVRELSKDLVRNII
jgi:hypothetical protein